MADEKQLDPAGQQVDISEFSLEQLASIKKQLEEEFDLVTNNLGNLKLALNKLDQASSAIKEVASRKDGAPVLVPLTSSLYVPGDASDVEHVMIDIGTGYFVKKTVPEAVEYFQRRSKMLNDSVSQVYNVITKKRQSIETVSMVMQEKVRTFQEEQKKLASKQSQRLTA